MSAQENNGSAVEFWRIKHSERPPKPPRLEGPFFTLSPSKILGQNATSGTDVESTHKKVDFDAGARKFLEGTLCGCAGSKAAPDGLYARTLCVRTQPRKSGLFMALFSYADTPKDLPFFILFEKGRGKQVAAKAQRTKEELFENYTIPHAVLVLSVPTILSSIVMVLYNLAEMCIRDRSERTPKLIPAEITRYSGNSTTAYRSARNQ